MRKFISYFDILLSHITPRDLTKGVKFSTIIHLGILLFIIIIPIIFPHRYRGFRPTVYTVQIVKLPGTITKQTPTVSKPIKKPHIETKLKPVQKKSIIAIPPAKPLKTPTLEEKLSKRLEEMEKTTTPEAQWEEPESIQQTTSSVSGTLGTSGTLDISTPSDFPFQYYLELIHGKISSCWSNPQMVLDKKYSAVISFTILKSGEITNINIKRSSGIANFDQSGLKAIELAKPFPQLPVGYKYSQLTVNVEFNLE